MHWISVKLPDNFQMRELSWPCRFHINNNNYHYFFFKCWAILINVGDDIDGGDLTRYQIYYTLQIYRTMVNRLMLWVPVWFGLIFTMILYSVFFVSQTLDCLSCNFWYRLRACTIYTMRPANKKGFFLFQCSMSTISLILTDIWISFKTF